MRQPSIRCSIVRISLSQPSICDVKILFATPYRRDVCNWNLHNIAVRIMAVRNDDLLLLCLMWLHYSSSTYVYLC